MTNQFTVQKLEQNLQGIQSRITAAAAAANRQLDEIKLIAVTKYVDVAVTRCLVAAGCRSIGESRPQVLWEKGEKLQDLDVEWHLIGHLQRNKVRKTLMFADQIHSCDSLRLLDAINSIAAESNRQVKCLLEVNISGESAKHGFHENDIENALKTIATLPHIRLNGLMGMGSWGGDPERNRSEFRRLNELKQQFSSFAAENIQLSELSMGMSGDFEIAIAEGATMVSHRLEPVRRRDVNRQVHPIFLPGARDRISGLGLASVCRNTDLDRSRNRFGQRFRMLIGDLIHFLFGQRD